LYPNGQLKWAAGAIKGWISVSSVIFVQGRGPKKKVSKRSLAYHKPAYQQNVGFGGTPDRAVDGVTLGAYSSGSCCHTKREKGAWWKVKIAKGREKYVVKKVVVWNRSDCCQTRLKNFRVKVCCPNRQCGKVIKFPEARNEFHCKRKGRWVQVELLNKNYLTLCEVQVYGYIWKRWHISPKPNFIWGFSKKPGHRGMKDLKVISGKAKIKHGKLEARKACIKTQTVPVALGKERTILFWFITFDLSLPKTLLSFVDNKSGAYDILRLDRRGRWGTDSEGKKRYQPFQEEHGREKRRKRTIMIAAVYDASGWIRLFRNGKMYGAYRAKAGAHDFSAGAHILLGCNSDKTGKKRDKRLWKRIKYKELSVYNKVLTQFEIKRIWKRYHPR